MKKIILFIFLCFCCHLYQSSFSNLNKNLQYEEKTKNRYQNGWNSKELQEDYTNVLLTSENSVYLGAQTFLYDKLKERDSSTFTEKEKKFFKRFKIIEIDENKRIERELIQERIKSIQAKKNQLEKNTIKIEKLKTEMNLKIVTVAVLLIFIFYMLLRIKKYGRIR